MRAWWDQHLTTEPAHDYAAAFAATNLRAPMPGMEHFAQRDASVGCDASVGQLWPWLVGVPLGGLAGYFVRPWLEPRLSSLFTKTGGELSIGCPGPQPAVGQDYGYGYDGYGQDYDYGYSVGQDYGYGQTDGYGQQDPWLDLAGPQVGGPWLDLAGPQVGGPWLDIAGPQVGGPWLDIAGPQVGGPWLDLGDPKSVDRGSTSPGPRLGLKSTKIAAARGRRRGRSSSRRSTR